MAVSTRQELLNVLLRSNLLTAEQLRSAEELAAVGDEPRAIAKRIVEAGWLTRWQAQQLLSGRTKLCLGKYKLLEGLGQGGMGTVLKAEQPGLNRIVALKVMSREVLGNTDAVERFIREIRLAAALEHPNIVRAFDADCVGQTYFLVMEYVAGDELKAWIRQHGRLPIPWACEVTRQAALGLQHAHENGLAHRDIKPANLLVERRESRDESETSTSSGSGLSTLDSRLCIKILDMGLAKFVTETHAEGGLTKTGQIMGTPDYMAPEQALSTRDADIRSDIFSLGCVLFEMLAGRVPFLGDGVMQKLMARTSGDAPRVTTLRPDVPPQLDEIVARMLAREVKQRYQTPGEVAEALVPFAVSTMPHVPQATVLLRPEPQTQTSRVEARADTTLNRFLSELDDQIADTPPVVATPAIQVTPVRSVSEPVARRSRRQVDGRWVVGVVGVMFAVVLIVAFLFFGKTSETDQPPPQPSTTPDNAVAAALVGDQADFAKLNHALEFDGTSSRVEIPTWNYDGKTALTIECRVTPHAVITDNISHVQILLAEEYRQGVSLGLRGNGKLEFFVGEEPAAHAGPEPIRANKTLHVAAVYDGQESHLYIEGKRQVSKRPAKPIKLSRLPMLLGASPKPDGAGAFFHGVLDEICISRTARYTADFTPSSPYERFTPDKDTIALYHCDEGTGDVLTDSSGNGHHGKIVGAKWVNADGTEIEPAAQNVEITTATFTAPDESNGIKPVGADYEQRTLADKPALVAPDSQTRRIGFDVDDAIAHDVPADTRDRFVVRATVLDAKPGSMGLAYDSYLEQPDDGLPHGNQIRRKLSGSGQWIELEFELERPRLSGRFHGGADFHLSADNDHQIAVHSIALDRVRANPSGDFTNALGMEFVRIPAGKSWLGGGGGKPGTREVEFQDDFYLGKYEVTQEEWQSVMGKNPSYYKRNGTRKEAVADIADVDLRRFPVEFVSWTAAQEFLTKLNATLKENGWVYRLPTENEWEYACRGGPMADQAQSAFDFYFDQPTNSLTPEQANSKDSNLNRPCQVGSYSPNRLGLHDMHGNIREWCHEVSHVNDQGVSRRAYRTGSWDSDANYCRTVSRGGLPPTASDGTYGLRLARAPVAGRWQSLFNGKDLTGWRYTSTSRQEATVAIEDGHPTLRLESGVYLSTRTLGDYHLRFEYQAQPGKKGGIHLFGSSRGRLELDLVELSPAYLDGFGFRYQQAELREGRLMGVGDPLGDKVEKRGFRLALTPLDSETVWQLVDICRSGDSFVFLVNGRLAGAIANLRDLRQGEENVPGRSGLTFWASGGQASFRNIELREINALPPEIVGLSNTAADGWVDLLPLLDLDQDAEGAGWSRVNETLRLDAARGEYPQAHFPVHPQGDYELELEFERLNDPRSGPLHIRLPIADRGVSFTIQHRGDERGLALGDGRQPIVAFAPQPRIMPAEKRLRCRLVVRADGANAVFRVEYGALPAAEQTIPLSKLPLLPAAEIAENHGPLALKAEGLLVRIHALRLRMLSGNAVLDRLR